MSNRPLTLTEGVLCIWVAVLLWFAQAHWHGFWHWWAIVHCVLFSICASATILRHVIGEERLARWSE